MSEPVWQRVGDALGSAVRRSAAVGGGDINEAFRVELADGRRVFVKLNRSCPEGMFEAEAAGLRWLAEANAIRLPRVFAVSSTGDRLGFLVLEHIDVGRQLAEHDELLGHRLAALHRFGAPVFGWNQPNYIGRLPQKNEPRPTWAEFYVTRRLGPMLMRAERAGFVTASLRRRFEVLFSRMPELVGGEEVPSRLHGDLWGGNAMCDATGSPVVFDPAVYGGDREMDLAMMRLFGGFSPSTFGAYSESYPLRPGFEERVPLCQLYPLLVHVVLFGAGYLGSLERALARYA